MHASIWKLYYVAFWLLLHGIKIKSANIAQRINRKMKIVWACISNELHENIRFFCDDWRIREMHSAHTSNVLTCTITFTFRAAKQRIDELTTKRNMLKAWTHVTQIDAHWHHQNYRISESYKNLTLSLLRNVHLFETYIKWMTIQLFHSVYAI